MSLDQRVVDNRKGVKVEKMKYGLQDKIIYLGGNRLHASDSENFFLSCQA